MLAQYAVVLTENGRLTLAFHRHKKAQKAQKISEVYFCFLCFLVSVRIFLAKLREPGGITNRGYAKTLSSRGEQ